MINNIASNLLLLLSVLSFLSYFDILKMRRIAVSYIIFFATGFAFITHVSNFAFSNLQVINVFLNSSLEKPLLYKIAGSWGNHEGSLTLWLFLLSTVIFSLNFWRKSIGTFLPDIFKYCFLFFSFFAGFSYFTSNPFLLFATVKLQGLGLNPILQDYALSIHPPILYLGYVATIPVFSISLLLLNHREQKILDLLRFWLYFSFSFLTLGISLGSWWAYRTLGWGGYWFWDPVENASLLPYLLIISSIHFLMLYKKKSLCLNWLLGTSIFACYSTILTLFLVRSGVLISVHSFASDPTKGIILISFLLCIILLGISKIFFSKSTFSTAETQFLSIENFTKMSMICLIVCYITILIGEIFPLFLLSIFDMSITIGEPYYLKTIIPITLIAIAFLNIAISLDWQKPSLKKLIDAHWLSIIISLLATSAFLYTTHVNEPISLLSIFFGLNIILISLRSNKNKVAFIAHSSIGLLFIAICINSNYQRNNLLVLPKNQPVHIHGLTLEYLGNNYTREADLFVNTANISIGTDTKEFGMLRPVIKYFKVEAQQVASPAILSKIGTDYYFLATEIDENKSVGQLYTKPLISFLWFSLLLLFSSGIFGLFIVNGKKK